MILTRWESWWCLGDGDEGKGDLQDVQLCNCATLHWATAPGKIFASPGLLHCTLIFALPTLALDFTLDTDTHCHLQLFICHFSFTHFDVKLPVLSVFQIQIWTQNMTLYSSVN